MEDGLERDEGKAGRGSQPQSGYAPRLFEEGVVRLLETRPEPVPNTDKRMDVAKTDQVAAEANGIVGEEVWDDRP